MLLDVPRRVGPVTGLGISRVDFDFKIFSSSNVLVIRTSKTGVDKTLKEGEDYTVTWDEDQTANIGGYITLDEFLTDGESITILSDVAYTQELDLHAEGDFNPNDINVNFDRTEAQIQQLKEKLSRAVTTDATDERTPREFTNALFAAKDASEASAKMAADSRQACEEIKQNIFQYSWDIPHVVETLRDVENYPYDGLFAVKGFGNPGQHGEDISNRVVVAGGSTEPRTLADWASDIVELAKRVAELEKKVL